MVMVAEVLPGLKRWLSPLRLRSSVQAMVVRMVAAFILHAGRMSCLQAAGSIRSEARHRAQVGRMLSRPSFRRLNLNTILRQELLEQESGKGRFLFILDATLCSQQGKKTEMEGRRVIDDR